MSLSNSFPNLRPTLLLDFSNGQQLDPRITFARASTARFYDGETVAVAEQNLFLQSQTFENIYWGKLRTTATADAGTAPDGSSTAELLAEAAVSGTHLLQTNAADIPVVNGLAYTFSLFIKKGSGATAPDVVQLTFGSGFVGTNYANFNLTTIAVTASSDVTASITDAGNGWRRCVITLAATSSTTTTPLLAFVNNNPTAGRLPSYTGVTTADLLIWGAQLEQRSAATAYTVTTTAPVTNYVPQLMTAASGQPRIDFDPITRVCRGLLIEESRQNLFTRSEEFNDAAWSKLRATIFANATVAPDGTLTADKFVATTDNDDHRVTGTDTFTGARTLSIYAKAGEYSTIVLNIAGVSLCSGTFRLTDGVITASGANATASIQNVGNGWYRCAISYTAAGTANPQFYVTNGVSSTFVGNDYNGIFVWGAQLEAGAFSTSYIATTTTALTRQADVASMTGANFSSWYRADEGTLFAEAIGVGIAAQIGPVGATNSNAMRIGFGTPAFAIYDATTTTTALGTATAGVNTKVAGAYRLNDSAVSINGAAALTDTSTVIPIGAELALGLRSSAAPSLMLNGHLRKLAYYPRRLLNSELVALTR